MRFRRTPLSILTGIIIYLIFIIIFYFIFNKIFVFCISFILCISCFYSITTYYVFVEWKITKVSLFFLKKETNINSINYIEAVKVKRAGYVYIRIGNRTSEDYYIFHLPNNKKVKIEASYKNKNISLGRYLQNHYKIKLINKEIVEYIYGNP